MGGPLCTNWDCLCAYTPLKVRELVYLHLTDEHGVASFVVFARRLHEGKCQAIFDLARYCLLADLCHAGLQHLLMVLASILV